MVTAPELFIGLVLMCLPALVFLCSVAWLVYRGGIK